MRASSLSSSEHRPPSPLTWLRNMFTVPYSISISCLQMREHVLPKCSWLAFGPSGNPNKGKPPNQKMSQKVEKVQKGGGRGQLRRSKSPQFKMWTFWQEEGGGHIFIFFPNVNAHIKYFSWRKNKLVLKWFLGNFKCSKLMFLFQKKINGKFVRCWPHPPTLTENSVNFFFLILP